MSALLTLENVTAGYIEDIPILRDVNVEIAEGAITGLIDTELPLASWP